MQDNSKRELRKLARDFKGKIELMKRTPIEKIEANFLELHEMSLREYIEREKARFPEKSRKEIIIGMHKRHDKLRGRK
jgi:hypothetical protein